MECSRSNRPQSRSRPNFAAESCPHPHNTVAVPGFSCPNPITRPFDTETDSDPDPDSANTD
ncbi:MAG: hypothetical protein ACOX52_17325 [Verrucomicrobiota bacterium]